MAAPIDVDEILSHRDLLNENEGAVIENPLGMCHPVSQLTEMEHSI